MKAKILILLTVFFMLSCSQAFAEEANLVINGGFEEELSGQASFWSKYDWEKDANKKNASEFRLDYTEKYSGNASGCIISTEPNDARYKQVVKSEKNTYYRLSCRVKTENVGAGNKGANISVEGIIDTSRDIKGTSNGWEQVELYGKTGDTQETFVVTLGLGGYGSLNTGKAWFDDVVVEKLDGPPAGRSAVNFYRADPGNAGNAGSNTSIVAWILAILAVFALSAGITYVIVKSGKTGASSREKSRTAAGGSIPRSEAIKLRLDKKDLVIMAAMSAVYLVIAFINLGSLKAPQTGWKPVKPGESFVIDLGRNINISRIYYNAGVGKGEYMLEYDDGKGGFAYLDTISPNNYDDFYRWRYHTVSATTSRIKFTVQSPGGVLNEVGIFEAGGKVPVADIRISENKTDISDSGKVENLFDEQDTIPYNPSFMNGTYFDEIYHARTAYEHIKGIEPYETTHPPLGKVLISLGILVFGMTPFGWRIAGTLFGGAMIPLMYMFGKKFFGERFWAFCAAFLMMFDFMHFTQTRISTIDVYVTFFVILMFYYMFDYYVNKSYMVGFGESLRPLFLCGLSFGLAAASKWIGLYGAAGLAALFAITKYGEIKDYLKLKDNKKSKKIAWIKSFIPLYINGTLLCCALFFIVIPAAIYLMSYIPFMMAPGPGHGLRDVLSYQTHMYNYHKNLSATHSFSSSWWQWPIMTRPMWYYGSTEAPAGRTSVIVSFGNPAVWWVGIAAVIASAIIAATKKDRKMTVALIAIAAQYLPWILVPRIAFIYHFFSIVPFVIISIVYCIKHIVEKYPGARYLAYAYLVVAAALFIWFYPALSGMEVSRSYIDSLKWFKSWVF